MQARRVSPAALFRWKIVAGRRLTELAPELAPERVLGLGPERVLGLGPERVLGPELAPERVLGLGPERVLAPGLGPERVLKRELGPAQVRALGQPPSLRWWRGPAQWDMNSEGCWSSTASRPRLWPPIPGLRLQTPRPTTDMRQTIKIVWPTRTCTIVRSSARPALTSRPSSRILTRRRPRWECRLCSRRLLRPPMVIPRCLWCRRLNPLPAHRTSLASAKAA